MSGCRSEAGRLFQILGPATEKFLSANRAHLYCLRIANNWKSQETKALPKGEFEQTRGILLSKLVMLNSSK